MDSATTSKTLLAPDLTHLGFAMKASGAGGKAAAVVLGKER